MSNNNHNELDRILSEINKERSKSDTNKTIDNINFGMFATEDSPKSKDTYPIQNSDNTENTLSKKHIAVTHVEVIAKEPKNNEPDVPKDSIKVDSNPKGKKSIGSTQKKIDKSQDRPKTIGEKKRSNKDKKRTSTVILGMIMSFFVIIGVFATTWNVTNWIIEIVNSTEKKAEFQQIVFPLVLIDVPEFDDPSLLDGASVISASIWDFIISKEDKSKYPKNELGSIYVPEVDIEIYARKLFGEKVKIVHQSIEDSSIQMFYDAENRTYNIESTPKFLSYTPIIDSILKTNDTYTLRVSYALPDPTWNLNQKNKVPKVDKIMEYRIKETKNNYQFLSVTLIEIPQNPVSSINQNVPIASIAEPSTEQ